MIKAILLSIHKKHNDNIENRIKSMELRKSIPKDLKKIIKKYGGIWVYNYETLSSDGRGKITNRWWFDEYTKINNLRKTELSPYYACKEGYEAFVVDWLKEELCLTGKEIIDYGKGKDLYAWHIKKLEIFEEPMELSEFWKEQKQGQVLTMLYVKEPDLRDSYLFIEKLKKPPQSYQFVYVKE